MVANTYADAAVRAGAIELQLFGDVHLHVRGDPVTPVLAQPKRFVLLVYLVLGRSSVTRFHRRDTLLGLFWPECAEDCARHALRQAVWYLRRHLGHATIESRGEGELRVDPGAVQCDVIAFEQAVHSCNWRTAMSLYRGDLLEGFFLQDAPELDHWIEMQRARLREQAASAAWHLAADHERDGNIDAARHWAHQAMLLSGDDEAAVRREMALLDRCGDRIGALRAYRDFVRRLASEYDAAPAPETVALAAAIRQRAECLVVSL